MTFKVTEQQLEAFQDEDFSRQMAKFLRDQFPDAATQDTTLLQKGVQQQVSRGHSYGLHTQPQLAVYVTTAWLLGADFDTKFPAAEEMLNSQRSGSAKQQWLSEFTQELFKSLKKA